MRLSVAAVLVLAGFASPLRAQSADSASTVPHPRGTYSLSFAAPGVNQGGGTGSLSFWRMMSERTNLGISVVAGVSRATSALDTDNPQSDSEIDYTGYSVSVGPAIRRYVAAGERVAPFLYGSAQVGYGSSRSRREQDDQTSRDSGVNGLIEAGAGIEWFPARAFSVSGYTGLRAQASSQGARSDVAEIDSTFAGIGTFTSALSVNIYFAR